MVDISSIIEILITLACIDLDNLEFPFSTRYILSEKKSPIFGERLARVQLVSWPIKLSEKRK